MKVCPECKRIFDDSKEFCGDCGIALIAKTMTKNNVMEAGSAAVNKQAVGQVQAVQAQPANSVIVNNVSKLEANAMSFYGEVCKLAKAPRLGRGSYAMLSVLRLLIFDVLTVFLVYNEVDKISALSQLGKGMSSFPSLPSVTPLLFLTIVNFACIIYLLLKRLRDMGLQHSQIQIALGGYGLLAAYSVWAINHGIDTIIATAMNGALSFMSKGPVDLLRSANDIVLAIKLIAILYAVALVMTFFKGSRGCNEYGEPPTEL